jgi:hypothetical protein
MNRNRRTGYLKPRKISAANEAEADERIREALKARKNDDGKRTAEELDKMFPFVLDPRRRTD